MLITAKISDTICGQAHTKAEGSTIVYAIDVASDVSVAGCGAAGRTVHLLVGDREMPTQAIWDNTHAIDASVAPSANAYVYLPTLLR